MSSFLVFLLLQEQGPLFGMQWPRLCVQRPLLWRKRKKDKKVSFLQNKMFEALPFPPSLMYSKRYVPKCHHSNKGGPLLLPLFWFLFLGVSFLPSAICRHLPPPPPIPISFACGDPTQSVCPSDSERGVKFTHFRTKAHHFSKCWIKCSV